MTNDKALIISELDGSVAVKDRPGKVKNIFLNFKPKKNTHKCIPKCFNIKRVKPYTNERVELLKNGMHITAIKVTHANLHQQCHEELVLKQLRCYQEVPYTSIKLN